MEYDKILEELSNEELEEMAERELEILSPYGTNGVYY